MKTPFNTPRSIRVIAAFMLLVMVAGLARATMTFPGPDLTGGTGSSDSTAVHAGAHDPGKKPKKTAQINGFSPDDIMGTVKALQANPELAKFQFRVRNKWIKGGHNRSRIQDFYGGGQEDSSRRKPFVYDNSEPPILLGNNEGANPVEYILHGLAGCLTTTIVLHAAANGIALKSVESSLEGDLDAQGFLGLNDQIRNGYQQIRVKFAIEGDLTEAQKQQLESFVSKSPVFDIVTNQVPVQVSLQY
jgi:uncharacterized OsmC-like protein